MPFRCASYQTLIMKVLLLLTMLLITVFTSFGQSNSTSKCRQLCNDKTKKDIQKSISFYKKRLFQIVADQDSYYNLGMCFIKLHQMTQAIRYLDTLIALNPKYYGALSNRGLCKLSLGDTNGACGDFSKSIEFGQDLETIDNMKLSEYVKQKCAAN